MHVNAISKLKQSMNGVHEVESKEAFKELAINNDVNIHHYICDNGVYQSKLF
jgi:hypothetical protein